MIEEGPRVEPGARPGDRVLVFLARDRDIQHEMGRLAERVDRVRHGTVLHLDHLGYRIRLHGERDEHEAGGDEEREPRLARILSTAMASISVLDASFGCASASRDRGQATREGPRAACPRSGSRHRKRHAVPMATLSPSRHLAPGMAEGHASSRDGIGWLSIALGAAVLVRPVLSFLQTREIALLLAGIVLAFLVAVVGWVLRDARRWDLPVIPWAIAVLLVPGVGVVG